MTEIGYILKGFRRTSETFITNEILLLEQEGVDLSIFSLKKLEGQKLHENAKRIKASVTYLPDFSAIALSHLKLFFRKPFVYLKCVCETIGMSYRYGKYGKQKFFKEFLQAGLIAYKVIESAKIRHLHAHFCHTSTTVAMIAGELAEIPFSFTAHAKDIYRNDMNPGDLLNRKIECARFVVTCTKANKHYLEKFNNTRRPVNAIYHGLDLTHFKLSKPDRSTQNPPMILSVGRMVEKKGFLFLVEACRILKDRGLNFVCRIVGGVDVYTEIIRRKIEELNLESTVKLHSAVTQEELKQIYEQAMVFALACKINDDGDRDGIPNVLVEAMAMELPVVSTNISGIPELIEHNINGLMVESENAEQLADALELLLNDPQKRYRLAEAARITVMRDFDARKNVIALKKLFDE